MTKTFEYEASFGESQKAKVSVVMGSQSDWEPCMQHACKMLNKLEIPFEAGIVSAHRTPDRMHTYAEHAEERGIKVIIAGAGGAAHLPGMIAGKTLLPVFGVPVQSKALSGLDSLLSIVQMPEGVPTATFSIGKPGAVNAALCAARILALQDQRLYERLAVYVRNQTESVPIRAYEET